jgi:hypothetical protein
MSKRSHADRQPTAQLKFPHFKLVWSTAEATDAKWHLRLWGHCYKGTPRRLFVYFGARNLLLTGTGATLGMYLAGTAALAWLWGQNPYNQISYADLVLPTHWSQLREKRGKGQVAEGVHEIRTGKYATGLMLLTQGIARNPSNVTGRMVLAQAYINMGYLHRGQQLLEDGLVFGPPSKSYREALFRLTAYLEDYERILELADHIEPTLLPADTTARRWLLSQRVTALEKLGRYDEIEKLRAAQASAPSFAIEAAWARMQATRGRPADALEAIARDPERFGIPTERYQLQLTLAVAARDPVAAKEAIQLWLKAEPTKPQPRIQEIVALIQLGETAAARDRLHLFFSLYASERTNVILLLKKLGDLPDIKWLQAATREAAESGALSIEAHILYVQGLMMAGRISEALTEFNLTNSLIEQAKVKDGGWSEGTKRLLDLIVSDSPSNRSLLLDFFRTHRLTPEAYRFALKSLRSAEVNEVADELALLARNRFPAMQEAAPLAGRTMVAAKSGETSVILFRTVTDARMELQRVDVELQAGNYQAAFGRLKALERAGFPALQSELLLRRIQVQGALREQGELSAALQLYLSRPNVNQEWLRKLALQWSTGQQPDSALTVAQETAAKFPQAKWATDLLNRPAPESTAAATPFTVSFTNEAEARAEMRQIDTALGAGRYTEALDRIKRVERSHLADLQPELLLRRIHAHGALREQTELAAALGYYLSGKTVNLTALRGFATQWDNDRQRDSALSLLRETLAKFPQAQWASELRKKIEGDLLVAPEKVN